MEESKRVVIFRKRAEKSIFKTFLHISAQGYPDRAERFADRLYDFGYTLNDFPAKYPICRFQRFAKHHFHCATFSRSYVFVYKVVKHQLIIYNIIHGKRLI